MWITCLLIPHLPVRVEQSRDPALARAPLVIGGRRWDEGAVLDCSHPAEAAGVEPGMRLSKAEALCPQAHFLPADQEAYETLHQALVESIKPLTPTVETEDLGLVYADISGLRRRFDEDADAAQRLLQETIGAGVPDAQIGVSSGKFVAEQAARAAQPGEPCIVPPGEERAFLSSLDISTLPLDLEMDRRLRLLGIRTLGALAQLPRLAVLRQFGDTAGALYDLACGKDAQPVHAQAPPLRLTRSHTFIDPVSDRAPLLAQLDQMADDAAREINRRGYLAEGLRLEIEEINGDIHDAGKPVKPPSSHGAQFSRLLTHALGGLPIGGPVARLSMTVYPLRPFHEGSTQLALFDGGADPTRPPQAAFGRALRETLRRLHDRFGELSVLVASLVVAPEPCPIQVTTDHHGNPRAVVWRERIRQVQTIYEHWRERRRWWSNPIERDYFRLEIQSRSRKPVSSSRIPRSTQVTASTQVTTSTQAPGRMKVIFRDVRANQWYLERRHI
jgi:DNA polymerase-4